MENTWNFSPLAINTSIQDSISTMREQLMVLKNKSNDGLHFIPITHKSIPTLKQILDVYGNHSCDFSLGGILMWADYFNYQYAISNNTLFLKGLDPVTDKEIYYSPVGEMNKEEALELLNKYSSGSRDAIVISMEEEEYDAYLNDSLKESMYIDDWKEYLYDIHQFIGFPGKKMSKKRNHLNYFHNHYPECTTEEINSSNIEELIKFTQEFEETHVDSELFENEAEQTLEVLRHYSDYPFFGIALRYEGKIIGYSIGEKIGDICFLHIEKGNIDYQGVYQAIASEMASLIASRYPEVRYLNREEDMGFESLRKSKESYHPTLIVMKKTSKMPLLAEKRMAI